MKTNSQEEKEDEFDQGMGSADEALLDMLGLRSLNTIVVDDDAGEEEASRTKLPLLSPSDIASRIDSSQIQSQYASESVYMFPPEFSVSADYMRMITEELVWGGDRIQADRTYETIQVWKNGIIEQRRTLTRLEHFVDAHQGWSNLCHGYLSDVLSVALGEKMVLYKEKLNLKPPGGSGFAPHLDSPSLRVALGPDGPQTFVTVMVAIDDMTVQNGCLRLCHGPWTEENHVKVNEPEENGNPDAGGRAGAIEGSVAEELQFEDLVCKGGSIAAFNGWVPHRSAANKSPFPRRAVFLTYNPASEGEFHKLYYSKMDELRAAFRESSGLAKRQKEYDIDQLELDALATVPK
eukprot:scaffold24788_cov117-Cylindrotheca_fusiformis.AAC.6